MVRGFGGLLVSAFLIVAGSAFAETRVALVVGNSAYRHAPRLANPANDADAVAAALKRLGFEVVQGRDLDRRGFEDALVRFGRKAANVDVAVTFFAGHAVQVDGVNYLLPIDAKLADDRQLKWETLPLEFALDEMRGARRLKVVILDACRDNPLANQMARSMATRSAGMSRGLAVVEKTEGDTLIAYATRAGTVAADGSGRHSPFTAAFLQHLEEPGVEIRQFFGKVRDTVLASTSGRQEPWVHGSLGGTGFYWNATGAPGQAIEESPALRAERMRTEQERLEREAKAKWRPASSPGSYSQPSAAPAADPREGAARDRLLRKLQDHQRQ